MTLCETCIHAITDGKKPVGCMAQVKYINRDSCMFYKEKPLGGKSKLIFFWESEDNDKRSKNIQHTNTRKL